MTATAQGNFMTGDYFHLSAGKLAPGSIVEPGNYGRIVLLMGREHPDFYREMALENARFHRFEHFPSRLDAAFGFISIPEAIDFRSRIPGFVHHILYRVSMLAASASSCLVESRLCGVQGTPRHDWADSYWLNARPVSDASPWVPVVPGIDGWPIPPSREVLTLSQLRIEERLD